MDEAKRLVKPDQSPVLLALANRYRASKAGREGADADFLADFRELLKSAASVDGDARVRAVEDLRRAAHESAGMLTLDLHPKDRQIIHRVRLRSGGEGWLFEQLGQARPAQQRSELAAFFREHAEGRPDWRQWLLDLAARAESGKSILPFEREDAAFNSELLRTVAAVMAWSEESLIRYASAVICGDSKRLEALQARLLQALRGITGDPETSLETYQILQTPRSVLVHGSLVLASPGGESDFGLLAGPVAVSGMDLELAVEIRSAAKVCLTVENEGVFRELAKRNPGVLLVHTSFPGAATRLLLARLPADMEFHHFGDSDPAGFDILRDLREKTGRSFKPVAMQFRPNDATVQLSDGEKKTIGRLLESRVLADVHPALRAMLDHGTKGDFEQESLGQSALRHLLEVLTQGTR